MQPKSEKPLRLFVNPFTTWTNLALKTGEAMLASAHAAVRGNRPKVAVIPTAAQPARHAAKPVRQASKAARAKVRSKAKAKRRAKR